MFNEEGIKDSKEISALYKDKNNKIRIACQEHRDQIISDDSSSGDSMTHTGDSMTHRHG